MKKTKLLTSLVALALVVSLGACETGDIIVNVGDVDIGDSSDTTDTEPSEPSEPSSSDTGSTPSEPEEDSSSSSSTQEEPPVVTHEYSIEVENADALKELTYDGNAATQQGVQLSIYLVDTPSEGTATREAATTEDVTFTVVDPTVVTVSGLTVLPLKEGSTSITIAWADKANTSVDVLVTDVTVNEPEGPTSWDEYITNENYRAAVSELFGSVDALDEFLPFYGDTDPTSIVTGTHYSKGARLVITYSSDVLSAWVSLFEADGWTQTDHDTPVSGETYTFEKDGYTVDLELEWGTTYVYVYPKAETGEESGEDLETAQAILDAAAAQTNGFQDFEYVNVQARYSNGGGGAYEHYNFDLTTDNSNVYGREIRHSEDGDDETKFRTRYYYEKYYYDINNETASNSHSGPSSNSYNGVNRVLGWRLTSSRNYDAAFDNASSIALESATDLELVTESNGNYKLTFIYNNTWYCYKATADCKLVGAGSAINWSDDYSYEIYYGEEESEETFNALMEPFFEDEYWFPKQASDEEIAQEILNAAAAQTSYYGGFGNLHIDGQIPELNLADYTTTISGDLTIDDNNNVFGKFQWANSDDPGPKIRYYYEKYYYYDNMADNGSHSYQTSPSSIGTGSSKNTINGVLDDRLPTAGFSSTYTCAFTNASSINLTSATDLELTTEDNGNYKLTLIYNDIWYCYKADTDLNLVGAGYSTNWTSSTNFEIVYGEETTRAAIDEIMNDEFFSVEVWFPKEEEETEPTCWADVITSEYDWNAITELLGATLDEVLPFYYETEGNPTYYQPSSSGQFFKLEYYPAPSGLSDAWYTVLEADGWEQTSGPTSDGWTTTTTYAKNGYTVKITLDGLSYWDLYLYPPEDTGEEEPANPGSSTVVDSDNIEDALSLLLEYGADTSSWSGVAFQDVIDYSENMYGFLDIDLEKFDETILATEKDGVVTGLDEDLFYLYGELYDDYSEYEYYDGTTLHSLDYGSYSSEETSLDLSYFTSYPLSQVQYDIAYLTQFSGQTTLYSYLGYEFDGGIKVSDDAITVTASVGAYQEGDDDEDYGEYQETLTITLEVVYDLDGGLISSSFNYIDYLYYPSISSSLTYSQTTTCSNFTGTIDTPTWVVNA